MTEMLLSCLWCVGEDSTCVGRNAYTALQKNGYRKRYCLLLLGTFNIPNQIIVEFWKLEIRPRTLLIYFHSWKTEKESRIANPKHAYRVEEISPFCDSSTWYTFLWIIICGESSRKTDQQAEESFHLSFFTPCHFIQDFEKVNARENSQPCLCFVFQKRSKIQNNRSSRDVF